MPIRLLVYFFLLSCSLNAFAFNIYDDVNAQRNGGTCPSAQLKPMTRNTTLDKVAARLAAGATLKDAMERESYKATQAEVVSMKSSNPSNLNAAGLAQGGYCSQFQNPAFAEVGVFKNSRELWVVVAAPFLKQIGVTEAAAGERILGLVNQARSSARLCGDQPFPKAAPLSWNNTLATAAKAHSKDMALHAYFDHVGHDGSKPAERVARAGYNYQATGENIAAGQPSPDEVVADWIKSPHHCTNIMSPNFTEMGLGLVVDPKSKMGIYWTQVFGKPQSRPTHNLKH